jgi:hypothetical protein
LYVNVIAIRETRGTKNGRKKLDYHYFYNSPNNVKRCWNCNAPIRFSPDKKGPYGKHIPLQIDSDEPHRCAESSKSELNANSSTTGFDNQKGEHNENENKYSKKVRLNLFQQHVIAELLSPDLEYKEILVRLDHITKEIEEIKQIKQTQERIVENNPSLLDDSDKKQPVT